MGHLIIDGCGASDHVLHGVEDKQGRGVGESGGGAGERRKWCCLMCKEQVREIGGFETRILGEGIKENKRIWESMWGIRKNKSDEGRGEGEIRFNTQESMKGRKWEQVCENKYSR